MLHLRLLRRSKNLFPASTSSPPDILISLPRMVENWNEDRYRRYIQAWAEEDYDFLRDWLHPELVVRYPGIPEINGSEAWIAMAEELHGGGLERVEVLWFLGGEGRHAAMLRSTIESRINAHKVLTFLNVRVGDRFTHEVGVFVCLPVYLLNADGV